MPVVVCMLRGINVGGHNIVKMEALRALCSALKFRNAQTYVQSGNVVFETTETDMAAVHKRLAKGFAKEFGFQPTIILRSAQEIRSAMEGNPFAGRRNIEPDKLLVSFLERDPGDEVRARVRSFKSEVEEIRIDGREMYIYFPNGMARPKFSQAALDKVLQTPATGRNWNSVTRLLEMAEALESGNTNGKAVPAKNKKKT
jgi:uncharacterized protein (DUF1697 family)